MAHEAHDAKHSRESASDFPHESRVTAVSPSHLLDFAGDEFGEHEEHGEGEEEDDESDDGSHDEAGLGA